MIQAFGIQLVDCRGIGLLFGELPGRRPPCRSPRRLPGGISNRDIDRSRLPVAGDREFDGVSNTDLLQNVGEIGHAVDRLIVRGGDDVLNDASVVRRALQARFRGRRLRQGPHDDDAINAQPGCTRVADRIPPRRLDSSDR